MILKSLETYLPGERKYPLRIDILICVFLVLATAAVYWQLNAFEFIGYDDDKYVTENPVVQNGLTRDGLVWAFKSTHASNWHPLTWLSHMLDVELYGMDAGAHHLTSLIFHIFNSLLLFLVFSRMTARPWQSGVVALLFALHPLHVESVAWVAERKDVLSTFLGLLTLWSYVRYTCNPGVARYLSTIVLFALGLMAKPMLVTLPFVMLLLDYWPLDRFRPGKTSDPDGKPVVRLPLRRVFYEKIPLMGLAGVSGVITFLAQAKGEAVGLLAVHPLPMRISNAAVSYVDYIKKMIWPRDLAVLYPYPGAVTAGQFIAAVLVLGGITFLSVRYGRRIPWLFVGWFWFLGTLVPVIGLVQVGVQRMADRYTYLPLVGLFVILSWGGGRLMAGWRYRKIALSVAAAALCILLVTAARAQVSYWKNSFTLFERTLEITKGNYVIHTNLGFELALSGRTNEAIGHYRAALRSHPGFELAHINLGTLLFSEGKIEESFAYHREILAKNPDFAGVHHNFGILLLQAGETDAAVIQLREALRIKPDYADAYNSLGAALVSQGRMAEAMASFRQALRIKPELMSARTNLENLTAAFEANPNQKIKLDFQ